MMSFEPTDGILLFAGLCLGSLLAIAATAEFVRWMRRARIPGADAGREGAGSPATAEPDPRARAA